MNRTTALPATCELCGIWLPGHLASCPRNGVHPSQWRNCVNEVEKSSITSPGYTFEELSASSFYYKKQESSAQPASQIIESAF